MIQFHFPDNVYALAKEMYFSEYSNYLFFEKYPSVKNSWCMKAMLALKNLKACGWNLISE